MSESVKTCSICQAPTVLDVAFESLGGRGLCKSCHVASLKHFFESSFGKGKGHDKEEEGRIALGVFAQRAESSLQALERGEPTTYYYSKKDGSRGLRKSPSRWSGWSVWKGADIPKEESWRAITDLANRLQEKRVWDVPESGTYRVESGWIDPKQTPRVIRFDRTHSDHKDAMAFLAHCLPRKEVKPTPKPPKASWLELIALLVGVVLVGVILK